MNTHSRFKSRPARFAVLLLALALPASRALAQDEKGPPHLDPSQHFTIDPVVDGVLIVGGLGFAGLLSLILSTGEIQPVPPGSPDKLLSIDHAAVTQTIDPNANLYSNIGLYAAYGYAAAESIFSGVKYGKRAFLIDAVLYGEALAITQAFTAATKIGVRRPRPIDYINCQGSATGDCSSTDLQLSFFSGHASTTGSIVGTATYLAFVRDGAHAARPWITLGVGTALTAFVSYERVRSGEHFPTDVIMGSMAGAAIGVLVPHFHRRAHYHGGELEAPPVWIGYTPVSRDAGTFTLGGRF
jgi:membrane-associated phospholipid phosphatase